MKLTKNQTITVIGIIVTAVLAIIGFFIKSSNSGDTYTVSSNNQSGGITASVVNIDQKRQRHLGQSEITNLQKLLPISRDVEIQIKYLSTDVEAKQFAIEIKKYLESEKWKVNPYLGTTLPSGPTTGFIVGFDSKGIWQIKVLAAPLN